MQRGLVQAQVVSRYGAAALETPHSPRIPQVSSREGDSGGGIGMRGGGKTGREESTDYCHHLSFCCVLPAYVCLAVCSSVSVARHYATQNAGADVMAQATMRLSRRFSVHQEPQAQAHAQLLLDIGDSCILRSLSNVSKQADTVLEEEEKEEEGGLFKAKAMTRTHSESSLLDAGRDRATPLVVMHTPKNGDEASNQSKVQGQSNRTAAFGLSTTLSADCVIVPTMQGEFVTTLPSVTAAEPRRRTLSLSPPRRLERRLDSLFWAGSG
jgi:hypothetical protein